MISKRQKRVKMNQGCLS